MATTANPTVLATPTRKSPVKSVQFVRAQVCPFCGWAHSAAGSCLGVK